MKSKRRTWKKFPPKVQVSIGRILSIYSHMKQQIFIILILALVGSSSFADWRVHSVKGVSAPVGLESLSIIEKFVHTHSGDYSTGVITNSVIQTKNLEKLKNQPQTPDAMAEQLQEALKTPVWEHQSVDGLEFYTLKWKEERRFLRLIIQKDKKFVRISFANLRQPYALIESLEADLLQRAFFKLDQKNAKTASLWPFLWNQLAPEAQALTLTTEQLQSAYRGFLESADSIARNVGMNSATELSNSIKGLSASGTSLGSDIRASGQNITSGMNNLADAARNAFTFMNGAKFGAGMGVGFTVASAVTNFVMDGSAKLVRELYYFATGKMKPEEKAALDARVGKAFDQLVQQSEKLDQVQKDLTLYEMAFSSAFLLPPKYMIDSVESADKARIDLESQLKSMQDKLSSSSGDQRTNCINAIHSLEGQLAKVNAMKAVLAEAGGKDRLCKKMTDLLDDWTVAEASLHRASRIVSSEMTTVLGQIQNDEISALEDPVSRRKKVNECESRGKKLASRNRELYQQAGCETKAGDADCAEYKYQIDLFDKAVLDCEAQYNRSEDAQSARSLSRGAELTNQQLAVAKKRLERIAAADCKAGEKNANCNGEIGDLEYQRQLYQSKAETYRKACPNLIPAAPVVNFSKASYESGFVDEKKDLQGSAPRAPQSEEKKKSGGFFDGIFGFFRKIFGGS